MTGQRRTVYGPRAVSKRLWIGFCRRLGLGFGLIFLSFASLGWAQPPLIGIEDPNPDQFYAKIRLSGLKYPLEVRQTGPLRRIDLAEGGLVQTYILDQEKGTLLVLSLVGKDRLAFIVPARTGGGAAALPLKTSELAPGTLVQAQGSRVVAGQTCMLKRFSGHLGRSGQICTRRDVIILFQLDGAKTPIFVIEQISFAPQAPKWFRVPPDYRLSVLPGLSGLATGQTKAGPIHP